MGVVVGMFVRGRRAVQQGVVGGSSRGSSRSCNTYKGRMGITAACEHAGDGSLADVKKRKKLCWRGYMRRAVGNA